MKKGSEEEGDLRPEYDLRKLEPQVRGKYVERYREGTNLVLFDPTSPPLFPTRKP